MYYKLVADGSPTSSNLYRRSAIIYLYVKQHKMTGLKYFGVTRTNDPFKYKGSGKHWKNHIKKWGDDIATLDVWGFDDPNICTEFAVNFSIDNNIVESGEWANMIVEYGDNNISGASNPNYGKRGAKNHNYGKRGPCHPNYGKKRSEAFVQNLKRKLTGKKKPEEFGQAVSSRQVGVKNHMYGRKGNLHPNFNKQMSEEQKQKISRAKKGKRLSVETRIAISEGKRGKPHPQRKYICDVCGHKNIKTVIVRYHNQKCKGMN